MGQKCRFDFYQPLPVYVEQRTSSDQPGGSGSCHKRVCMNWTGANEATNRHNLLAQRITAVGALIASRVPWCVAGISAF